MSYPFIRLLSSITNGFEWLSLDWSPHSNYLLYLRHNFEAQAVFPQSIPFNLSLSSNSESLNDLKSHVHTSGTITPRITAVINQAHLEL